MSLAPYDLFSYPRHAGWKEPTTSRDAAKAIEPRAKVLRRKVLDFIKVNPGASADEIAASLNERIWSIRPRVSELHRDCEIEKTGQRKTNSSGMTAHCWRVHV